MITIQYEESKTSVGMPVIRGSVRLNGGTKVVYGATREEVKQKLVDWLGNYYDLGAESFVTLPSPSLSKAEPVLRKGVVSGVAFMILIFTVVAGLAFLASLLEDLIK